MRKSKVPRKKSICLVCGKEFLCSLNCIKGTKLYAKMMSNLDDPKDTANCYCTEDSLNKRLRNTVYAKSRECQRSDVHFIFR